MVGEIAENGVIAVTCHMYMLTPLTIAKAWTLAKPENQAAISLYRTFGMQIVNQYDTKCGIRLALPSSKKYNPDVRILAHPIMMGDGSLEPVA